MHNQMSVRCFYSVCSLHKCVLHKCILRECSVLKGSYEILQELQGLFSLGASKKAINHIFVMIFFSHQLIRVTNTGQLKELPCNYQRFTSSIVIVSLSHFS